MQIKSVLFFIWIIQSSLNAFSLKDKILEKGKPGDYMITEQGGTLALLMVRFLSQDYLILEAVDIPKMDYKHTSWKEWISQGALGHTAWVSYMLDLKQDRLLEIYSHSQGSWLYADDPHNFLSKLLALPLYETPEFKRKRIGPPPGEGEIDRRSFWYPSVIFEGTEKDKPPITTWSSCWPQDDSIISNCDVMVYFSDTTFPYWMEIQSPHYRAAIKTVDAGANLLSPKPIILQQSPLFIGPGHWQGSSFELEIYCPPYYSPLQLVAIEFPEREKNGSLRKFLLVEEIQKAEETTALLALDYNWLQHHLVPKKKYRLALISKNFPEVMIYSEQIFELGEKPFP